MPREKRVRIFLGSPGDVPNERKLTRKVMHELNEVVGREKNVFFDLYDSGHAYPTYGPDGQEAINQQLGDMRRNTNRSVDYPSHNEEAGWRLAHAIKARSSGIIRSCC